MKSVVWHQHRINELRFERETIRVILHGVLHLVGFNDKSDEEKIVMREKEAYYLDAMNTEENLND